MVGAASRLNPNLVLIGSGLATVLIEVLAPFRAARYGPECVVAALALAVAWLARDRLDARIVVGIAVMLPASLALVHLARGVAGDVDVAGVYPAEGGSLLHGTYPRSEYPPGAVVLFALETFVGSARSVNPFVMAVCQGAIVWAIASLHFRDARWLAAAVAVWPANAFFWEFKFDALPAALLVLGLAFALRERWTVSGALLGVGAAVKWTPALSFALLVLWLVSTGRRREAVRHATAFALAAAVVVLPFVVWSADAVWASVKRQAPRGLTPESLWYLPLRILGQASKPGAVYDPAVVPSWADPLVVVVQALVLLSLALFLIRRRPTLPTAVAVAALAPVLFLLLNKVFSAQYLVVILPAAFVAAALLERSRIVAALLLIAATANVFVYPLTVEWRPASSTLFVCALGAALVLLLAATDGRALRRLG